MKCYKCNATLSEKNYCTSCGADVAVYKKIIGLSNMYYNDGLEKAKVRDLSGAIVSLKRSLKYNKKNFMARNLLGLVYFEVGETVAALGQWIISTNQKPKKNIAQDYIKTLSANQGRLDAINQTIRKYNLSIEYCKQGSYDLAVIQLKKLLSVNTKLVQGYQLLALLYMRDQDYEKAFKQLQKAIKIDSANTTTLYYLQEVQDKTGNTIRKTAIKSDEGIHLLKKSKDKVEFRSGNEMIIQPANIKENNGIWTIVNIVIGLVIGAAVMGFLITPAQVQVIKNKYKDKETDSYEQLQSKNAEIDSLNAQIAELNANMDSTNSQLANYEGDSGIIPSLTSLVEAERIYITGDIAGSFKVLVTVNKDALPDSAKTVFQELYDGSMTAILAEAYNQYKNRGNCETAITYYQQILSVDGGNEEAIYHCAAAYKKNGQTTEAIQMYNTYQQMFPSGKYTSESTKALKDLQ